MDLDLTGKQFLSPFELCFLVNGCKALWVADRYAEVTIRAHRSLLAQLDLLTRWGPRWHQKMSGYIRTDGIVTFVEVPKK
jgi:hypothetical protein